MIRIRGVMRQRVESRYWKVVKATFHLPPSTFKTLNPGILTMNNERWTMNLEQEREYYCSSFMV
jgi:hypothetical protein